MSRILKCLFGLPFIFGPILGMADDGPQRRFEKPLTNLKAAILKADSAENAVANLATGKVRGNLFAIEGLLRLYEAHPDVGRMATKQKLAIKGIEDEIGAYDDAKIMAKLAKEINAPEELQKLLQSDELAARRGFVRFLRHKRWIPAGEKNILGKIEKKINKAKWDGKKDDRDFLLAGLADYIEKIRDDKDYDLDDLEEGIHEFRRNIRWISIIAAASDGLIQLADKCPYKELKDLLKDPVAQSEFAKLPPSDAEKKPCYLSKCAFLGVVKAVGDLGDIKDVGQWEEFFTYAIEDSHFNTGDKTPGEYAKGLVAKTKLVMAHPKYADYTGAAKELYEGFSNSNVLTHLRDELKECRK